ncbi:MAG: helix-turn-helix domain-containing protein [Wolbachia endosymbiont of Penenirmus auritus]|nr:helix-turn-helix domain-containing protein [Wolbachia endosymbiont of Penenirmus auritus]
MVKHTTISIRHQIAQNIRSCILKRKCTVKNLANKTGIGYYTLLRYVQGKCGIPTGELEKIANALDVRSLFPKRKVLRENGFSEAKDQMMYNFMGKYTQTRERESRKAIYALTQSVRAQKESNAKAARIRMARNMLEMRFATNIIYQATGLSADEYNNKEKKTPKRQDEGEEIKKWRIIRGYTQGYLAERLGTSSSKIHNCEQGNVIILGETLYEIAEELSKDAEDLMHKPTKKDYYEDSEGENEQLSWMRECKKIDDQESLGELDILIEFLSQRRQIYEEKINRMEGIKVANNLIRMDVSIDVISQITGLSADEITQLESYTSK